MLIAAKPTPSVIPTKNFPSRVNLSFLGGRMRGHGKRRPFGLVGAAGALGAAVFGGVADRRGPEAVIRMGAALVVGAFVAMGVFQESLVVLVAGALVFDLGTAGALIGHQTIIYGLDPDARSRTNAVLVTSMFLGMALGSFAASQAYGRFGWSGVCALGVAAGLAALVTRIGAAR